MNRTVLVILALATLYSCSDSSQEVFNAPTQQLVKVDFVPVDLAAPIPNPSETYWSEVFDRVEKLPDFQAATDFPRRVKSESNWSQLDREAKQILDRNAKHPDVWLLKQLIAESMLDKLHHVASSEAVSLSKTYYIRQLSSLRQHYGHEYVVNALFEARKYMSASEYQRIKSETLEGLESQIRLVQHHPSPEPITKTEIPTRYQRISDALVKAYQLP